MKKLLYLFLAITIISCGGDDDESNTNNGTWTGTYQTDAGDSGTWTLVPNYEDGGSGYIVHSGEIISDLYGTAEFEGYTDESDNYFNAVGYQDEGDMPEYFFEADLNGNSLVNTIIYTDGTTFESIGTFTGTKN